MAPSEMCGMEHHHHHEGGTACGWGGEGAVEHCYWPAAPIVPCPRGTDVLAPYFEAIDNYCDEVHEAAGAPPDLIAEAARLRKEARSNTPG